MTAEPTGNSRGLLPGQNSLSLPVADGQLSRGPHLCGKAARTSPQCDGLVARQASEVVVLSVIRQR